MKFRKHYYFSIFFYFLFCNIVAQPTIQWQRTYGGTSYEEAFSACNTIVGGLAIIGYTLSTDGDITDHHLPNSIDNFWVIRLDSLGNISSNKCYGGPGIDEGHSIIQNEQGGFILAGYASDNGGDVSGVHGIVGSEDFWIVKIDSGGVIQWQKCFGGSEEENLTEIAECSDSDYLAVGTTNSFDYDVGGNHGNIDAWVIKIDRNGTKQWAKSLGGVLYDEAVSSTQASDGNYLIACSTISFDGDVTGLHNNSQDVWIVKLNSSGQIIWQKCYGGSSGDFPSKIIATNDGGFYISATTYSNDGDVSGLHGTNDFWIFKADSVGVIQWQKCIGGTNFESSKSADKTSDGGIIIAGIAKVDNGVVSGTHGGNDFWIAKIDSIGNFEWGKCLGGSADDNPHDIKETPDGGFIVVGSTTSHDGDITSNHGNKDFWVVKLYPAPVSIPGLENSLMDLDIFQNNEELILRFFSKRNDNLQIFIYDINGKKILDEKLMVSEGINYSRLNCSGLSKGMYFVSLDGNKGWLREKVVIQ